MPTDLTPESVQALLDAATPGPWHVSADCQTGKDYWHVEVPIGPAETVADAVLTRINRYGKHKPQADGNADLLAAAPDLARALLDAWRQRDEARAALTSILALTGGETQEEQDAAFDRSRRVLEVQRG